MERKPFKFSLKFLLQNNAIVLVTSHKYISLHVLLKMVVLLPLSRVGGNNRAHFEPETIYIVIVGSVPSRHLRVELRRHTHDHTLHIFKHTHVAALWKETDFVYLRGRAGCSPYCGCLWMASMLEI